MGTHHSQQNPPAEPTPKNFADIRVKLGKKKSPGKYNLEGQESDLPSEIGDDHWGEIPLYWHRKNEEAKQRER